jgi:CDP-glucose 4,6-dehydratase
LLEAVKATPSVRATVNVTTDKCYENKEWLWGYRENEPMGGHDPYSSSKACSELVSSAYRQSYQMNLATARAGNVIGGGDWAEDRLIPDMLRAFEAGQSVKIRHPNATRPWQHVLEPVRGYLTLAERLYANEGPFASAFNFGPLDQDVQPVAWIVAEMVAQWGERAAWHLDKEVQLHEANFLKLDCSKASALLGWKPSWQLVRSLGAIIAWHKHYQQSNDMRQVCLDQINAYVADVETMKQS